MQKRDGLITDVAHVSCLESEQKVLSVTLIKNVGQEILKKDNGLYPSVKRCPINIYICRPDLGSKIES